MALLDTQDGVRWDGPDAPVQTPDDALAIHVHNHLSNGMGGIDWAGLPLVVELLGVIDIEMLLHRLLVIRSHTPDTTSP
jgi:hypothetical protein